LQAIFPTADVKPGEHFSVLLENLIADQPDECPLFHPALHKLRTRNGARWTESFIPATPATKTDVSTTPLDLRRFCDNGYLRLFLLGSAVLPNGTLNVLRRNVADILRSLFQSGQKLCFPIWPLSSRWQIAV